MNIKKSHIRTLDSGRAYKSIIFLEEFVFSCFLHKLGGQRSWYYKIDRWVNSDKIEIANTIEVGLPWNEKRFRDSIGRLLDRSEIKHRVMRATFDDFAS
jgi:hypothetical protein